MSDTTISNQDPDPDRVEPVNVSPAAEQVATVDANTKVKDKSLTDEQIADLQAPGTVRVDSNNPDIRTDGIQNARPASPAPVDVQGPPDVVALVLNGVVKEADPNNPQPGDQVIAVTPRVVMVDGQDLQRWVDEQAEKTNSRN